MAATSSKGPSGGSSIPRGLDAANDEDGTIDEEMAATVGTQKIAPIDKATYACAGPIEANACPAACQACTIRALPEEGHSRGIPGAGVIFGVSTRSPCAIASMHTTPKPVASAY